MLKTTTEIHNRAPDSPKVCPGPLRSEAVLTIQTRETYKLIVGRSDRAGADNQKPTIMGLPAFGRRMNHLWIAAQYDDPYADWYLWQIEAALNSAIGTLQAKNTELTQLLTCVNAITITPSHSMTPVTIALNFTNPYGYKAAALLAEFDALMCLLLTAWHVGLMERTTKSDIVVATSKLIRRAFMLSTQWKFTGVTRTAIRAGEKIALEAQAKMGVLPQNILDLKKRSNIAPKIRSGSDLVIQLSKD